MKQLLQAKLFLTNKPWVLPAVIVAVLTFGLLTSPAPPIERPGGSSNVDLSSVTNIVLAIAVNPTNGITAGEAAVLIDDTNVNRIQPVVNAKLATTNNYVKRIDGGSTNQAVTNAVLYGTLDAHNAAGISGVTLLTTSGLRTGGGVQITNLDGGDIVFGVAGDEDFVLGLEGIDGVFHFTSQKGGSFSFSGGAMGGNGSGLTNLLHSSTVSAGANVTVTKTKNPDGSTNYQVAASSGGGSQTPLAQPVDAAEFPITNVLDLSFHTNLSGSELVAGFHFALDSIFGAVLDAYAGGDFTEPGMRLRADTMIANGRLGSIVATNAGVMSKMDSNSVTTGTITANNANFTTATATTLWVTNMISPTNAFAGTVADFNQEDGLTNLGGNLTFTAVANVTAGGVNTRIIRLLSGGTDRTIGYPASWKPCTNFSATVPNGGEMDVLITVLPGIRTNIGQIIYP